MPEGDLPVKRLGGEKGKADAETLATAIVERMKHG
jgi:hypothetical protein